MADTFPEDIRKKIKIDDKIACEQWNRGIGFIVVTENNEEAQKLIDIARGKYCEAEIAGAVTDKPEINWRGHTWKYK